MGAGPAGPAGLSFATTAAKRGHSVTLFDGSHKIGGQFNMAKKIPGKEEFYETIRYFEHRIKAKDVTLNLNTTIVANDLATSFDAVILATGVNPRQLTIPGIDHPMVLYYIDIIREEKHVGDRGALFGAGGIGFDVADFLSHRAKNFLMPT